MTITDIREETITDISFNSSGLKEPQIPHSETLIRSINARGYALDLSTMGTGKTYAASAIARHYGSHVFVICPKIVRRTWEKILTSFGVKSFKVANYEKVIRGNTPDAKQMKFAQDPRYKDNKNGANCAYLLRFNLPPDSLIIFDEAHKCKGEASSSSELLLAAWMQKYRFLLLSASQAATPMDMFILGRILNQHKFHDYPEWLSEFGGNKSGYWRVRVDMNCKEAIARMKELHHDIFTRGIASRMVPEMFGDSFKNNEIFPECFDMGEDGNVINSIYQEMMEEIRRLEDRGYKDCILAEIMKARRLAELHKVSTFVSLAMDMYEQGKSIAIFVNFKETLEAIVGRLAKKIGRKLISIIRGGQKEVEREEEIDKFQSDTTRVIVCNIGAGGVGVSLHDLFGNFPRVALLSPTWSAIQFKQATGRIHRQGGMTDCLQYVVFCADSIEEQVCYNLKGKLGAMDILNDGDLSLTGYGLEGIDWEAEDEKANAA